mgnify:CR=1 FL=1
MVTKRDDNRRRQGEYRGICLGKAGRQSFAKTQTDRDESYLFITVSSDKSQRGSKKARRALKMSKLSTLRKNTFPKITLDQFSG